MLRVSLPGTTSPYTTANIFARASGYIDKRNVDIGDHVKQGQLLAEIVAPELDHQIVQAQATLELDKATLRQNQANRDLAQITLNRDHPLVEKGWVTQQQGSVDEQNLKALAAAVGVAQQSIAAQEAQLKVLQQEKVYQKVVAPFDGVITQRNIDVGTLVQADATSGTFMFTLMQTGIIRTHPIPSWRTASSARLAPSGNQYASNRRVWETCSASKTRQALVSVIDWLSAHSTLKLYFCALRHLKICERDGC